MLYKLCLLDNDIGFYCEKCKFSYYLKDNECHSCSEFNALECLYSVFI